MKLSIWIYNGNRRLISFDGAPYIEPKSYREVIAANIEDIRVLHLFAEDVGIFDKMEVTKESDHLTESQVYFTISSFLNVLDSIKEELA